MSKNTCERHVSEDELSKVIPDCGLDALHEENGGQLYCKTLHSKMVLNFIGDVGRVPCVGAVPIGETFHDGSEIFVTGHEYTNVPATLLVEGDIIPRWLVSTHCERF